MPKKPFQIDVGKKYHTDNGLVAHVTGYNKDTDKYYGYIEQMSLALQWYKSGIQIDNLRDFDCVEEIKGS